MVTEKRVKESSRPYSTFSIEGRVPQSPVEGGEDTNRNMVDRILHYLEGLSERKVLLSLLGITFGLRLYIVLMAAGLPNDSAGYGFMARDFLRGDFLKGLSPAFHPLYPYLISLLSPGASHVEITGRLISLFFGTVALVPVYYLVKEAFGQRVAVFSGLFYCFHPYLVTYSGMLLSEATYWCLLTLSVYFFWFGLKRGKAFLVRGRRSSSGFNVPDETGGSGLPGCFSVLGCPLWRGEKGWVQKGGPDRLSHPELSCPIFPLSPVDPSGNRPVVNQQEVNEGPTLGCGVEQGAKRESRHPGCRGTETNKKAFQF